MTKTERVITAIYTIIRVRTNEIPDPELRNSIGNPVGPQTGTRQSHGYRDVSQEVPALFRATR